MVYVPTQLELLLMTTKNLSELKFKSALEAFLETRRPHITQKSFYEYSKNITTLTKFFGAYYPIEIDADMIRRYQRKRTADGVGPSAVNHETCVLQQLLKRIGRWPIIQPDFQPLRLPKWQPGRIITPIEAERLFRIGAEHPNWEAVYLFAKISINSTCGPKEVATLRHLAVDLGNRKFVVQPEGAKREARIRVITLNDESLVAMTRAIARARRLGSTEDYHYIFPAFVGRTKKYDPTRYQRSFRTAWAKWTRAADLVGLRMYDLRRTAITDLLSDENNSEETVRQCSGHISHRTVLHYSYRRIDKVRDAFDRLAARRKPAEKQLAVVEKPQVENEQPSIDAGQKKPAQSVKNKKQTALELLAMAAKLMDLKE